MISLVGRCFKSCKCAHSACCCASVCFHWITSLSFCTIYHRSLKPSPVLEMHTPLSSLLFSFTSVCLSLLPQSVRPSTHLVEVRSVRTRRGKWSGARDGATAGAQSDKEKQITPLTRAIHHLFISPSFYPSLLAHLSMMHTWIAIPGKKNNLKIHHIYNTWNLPILLSFSLYRWGLCFKVIQSTCVFTIIWKKG